jgi:hypothetical protein
MVILLGLAVYVAMVALTVVVTVRHHDFMWYEVDEKVGLCLLWPVTWFFWGAYCGFRFIEKRITGDPTTKRERLCRWE